MIYLAVDQVIKINNGKTVPADNDDSDEEESSDDDEQPPVKKGITIFNVDTLHLMKTNIYIHKLINILQLVMHRLKVHRKKILVLMKVLQKKKLFLQKKQ